MTNKFYMTANHFSPIICGKKCLKNKLVKIRAIRGKQKDKLKLTIKHVDKVVGFFIYFIRKKVYLQSLIRKKYQYEKL